MITQPPSLAQTYAYIPNSNSTVVRHRTFNAPWVWTNNFFSSSVYCCQRLFNAFTSCWKPKSKCTPEAAVVEQVFPCCLLYFSVYAHNVKQFCLFLSARNAINELMSDIKILTLKTPRKLASENVVCLCRLLNILFRPVFAYRQTVWTLIRLLLEEQSDLDPHCLQK